MKLALIGNCAYQALIDDCARVVWLCWPRFDSSFVFGALIDEQKGGEFSIKPGSGEYRTEQEYVSNTNILKTVFRSGDNAFEVIDFAPRFRLYERYYKPTMLVRRLRRISGEPVVQIRCSPTYDYGRSNLSCHQASNHLQWSIPGAQLRLTTNMPLTYIREERPFLLEAEAWVVLTWGEPLEAPLQETCSAFLEKTQLYWERWIKHTALPGQFQREVVRSALALKLHQYEDTGAITAATTTSIPEYPNSGRNWDYRYCWLRDAYFTLKAMWRLGHFEELEMFVSFLKNIAASHDTLQPVYSITGEAFLNEEELPHLAGYRNMGPVRAGNDAYRQVQYDVYGEMIAAIAPFFLDFRFQDHLTPYSNRLVRRLLDHIAECLEKPDAGLWERRTGSHLHTFSLLFHWFGGRVGALVGRKLQNSELESMSLALSAKAHKIIEGQCFREKIGMYADSTTTNNADAALLMMVNLGYLNRDHKHAVSHLRALERELNVKGHLMHRYRHHDGIGDTHATFTACGFWYVEALARLGFVEEATAAFSELSSYRNHVGLMSEDTDPMTGEQWGNFPQTYSHVGIINSAFAINPLPLELEEP